jgi:hypothetical protein
MAVFHKPNGFTQNVMHKVHNFNSDQLVVALVSSAYPPSPSYDDLSDVTQIDYTYCSSRNITKISSGQSFGVYKLVLQDLVLTATSGSVGPFRYVYVYNDTSTGDMLVGYYDYSTDVTLQDGDRITIDFDGENGIFTFT